MMMIMMMMTTTTKTMTTIMMVVVVQIKLSDLHELDDCTWMTLRNSAQH